MCCTWFPFSSCTRVFCSIFLPHRSVRLVWFFLSPPTGLWFLFLLQASSWSPRWSSLWFWCFSSCNHILDLCAWFLCWVHQAARVFCCRFFLCSFFSPLARPVKPASLFLFPSPNFSPHQGGVVPLTSLLVVSILRRACHQASVRSSCSAHVLASSTARAQAARFLRFSARLALGRCCPSCMDLFFLPCLIWCMLLIHFFLASRIHASSEQNALSTDFPRCFLLSPTESWA
jgi:hypothetical protein